ncbi:dTDP-glucose 4,6-dehydratase [Tengunoibacter tsumagoiensis]|uniref:dTDP-glucose 4,6-dehydratase n=1 Tax=Tengunoibacter tsumagoiensis TaxID=2014871 RepID=A0A401ZWI8_9CHLR|nr:dTDP-glucose 4,6-dehydratase [Tengunoibacter tsumagoiensis]GCE11176.1 dTDP-glucose 4,6-dehydratase [Tengunoibacter tsumagoiensis]
MRILVTGGAGFIGSAFVRTIMMDSPHHDIVVLDKLTYAGNLANLAPVSSRLTFIQGDICDPQIVADAMAGCDAVVHFAAETHVDRSLLDAQDFLTTNIYGTYTLLEAARKQKVQRFLQISTDEVYGNALSPAGVSRPSVESDPFLPLSPYAASKAGADNLAYSYWATYGLPVTITRCSNNYGPYQYPEKQLPLFILNALEDRPLPIYGDGQHSRDWIYVQDHIAALLCILQHEDVNGAIFNIGATEERTTVQNACTILELTQKPLSLLRYVPDRSGHVRRHAVNASKLQQTLNWQPTVTFSEGIRQTICWYQEQLGWLEEIKARHNAFLHHALNLANSVS